MGAPVVHFEIISRNGEQLKGFYSKLFGWEINSDNEMKYGLVKQEGKGIGGGISSPGPDGIGHVTIYAAVPDPQATLDQAVGMGATVVMPVTEIPNMVTFALFTDPDGNKIGIIKDQMPTPPPKKKAMRVKKILRRKSAATKKGKAKRGLRNH